MDHDPDRHDDRAIAIALCAQELLGHSVVGTLEAFFESARAEREAGVDQELDDSSPVYETALDRAFSSSELGPTQTYTESDRRRDNGQPMVVASVCAHGCGNRVPTPGMFCLECDPEQVRERVRP
jgi:hypothetical protein